MPRRNTARAARERNAAAQRRRRERMNQAQREAEVLRNAQRNHERREALALEERQALAERQRQVERERRAELDDQVREVERLENARAHAEARRRADRANRAACDADSVLSGRQQVVRHGTGPRDAACPHCGALLWREEWATLCCSGGKVNLDPLPAPPPLLRELWTGVSRAPPGIIICFYCIQLMPERGRGGPDGSSQSKTD